MVALGDDPMEGVAVVTRHDGPGGGLPSAPRNSSAEVITLLTPPRPDVHLDARPGNEVTLLPTVLGKGGFGRVVEGLYQGQRVAVKMLLDTSLCAWGVPPPPSPQFTAAEGSTVHSTNYHNAGAADGRGEAAATGAVTGGMLGGSADLAPAPPPATDRHMGSTAAALAKALSQEVAVLSRCRHPNIVTLLAACLQPPRFCLVLERCETSLDKLLYGRPGELLTMEQVLSIAVDVAHSLEYLHPTVMHRDLKPANVLINHPGTPHMVAKVSDFGLSRLRSTVAAATATAEAGTPTYMAPEQFAADNNVITHKIDVYAFGVLLDSLQP
ncbi:hypothetical protein GPECTOR_13g696 [Gonium pectorale]|uniref:Protein kinase domain-containing protein n=1 Tax=Gonium pectorale TaxID=33097 RepID=A0A150GN06_GONPE|nr:hypothetical protein GPECTOR_13g696 [Gonium pectorale]|eukprot:KXZ51209.1 hypothetical protein GPECTOR_13g696 [Gonium pectorale]